MRPETLALLTAQGVVIKPRIVDGGERPNLSHIAGALSGVSRQAYLYAASKWIGDKSVEPELFYRIYVMVGTIAAKEKWRIPKGKEILRGLTKLAIIEEIEAPVCPKCKGSQCKTCNHTGFLRLKGSERADLVGVSRYAWCRNWSYKYPLIVNGIRAFESEILEKLRVETC